MFTHLLHSSVRKLTNPHHNQKPRAKPPEIHHSAPTTLHEVIGVRTSAAYPVGERSEDVGGDNKEGKVVAPEGGGKDDEEEAYGEDLNCRYGERCWRKMMWRWCAEERLIRTKESAMIVLRPAAMAGGGRQPVSGLAIEVATAVESCGLTLKSCDHVMGWL